METVHTSIYSRLMTVLFYTTASICALRAAAWLSVHTLLPALSRIISHYHNYYYSHADDPARHIPSSSSPRPQPLGGSSGQPGSAVAETLFTRVRTAAGHHRFVPVSIAGPHHVVAAADSTASAQTTLLRLRGIAMLVLISVSVGGILARYYPHFTAVSMIGQGSWLSPAIPLQNVLSDSRSPVDDKPRTSEYQLQQQQNGTHRAVRAQL